MYYKSTTTSLRVTEQFFSTLLVQLRLDPQNEVLDVAAAGLFAGWMSTVSKQQRVKYRL